MHVSEESDSGIVPMKPSNNDRRTSAENGEGRPLIKENPPPPHTYPTQSGARVSQGLAGVRKVAKESKETRFTALLHHLTVDLLRESFYALKRKAAPQKSSGSAVVVSSSARALPLHPHARLLDESHRMLL
jgi:RNA-directed DNA polymerase